MRKTATFLCLAAMSAANAGVTVTSEYFLTSGGAFEIPFLQVLQGTGVNRSWAAATGEPELAIAVGNEVRTLGHYGTDGAEYTLAGVDTGTRYPYPTGLGSMVDGTTDMTHNYVVDYSGWQVFRFDRDWADPLSLFHLGFERRYAGITYDYTDNTLWISGWDEGIVQNRAMDGTVLSSFTTPFASITCLALDHATGTLWMGSQLQLGTFFQYSKAGTALGSVFVQELTDNNTMGGEFVPEPAGLVGVSVGLLALLIRRRQYRSSASPLRRTCRVVE